jgi:phosphatidylglycerophosphate synthase
MSEDWRNETIAQTRNRLRRVWGDYLTTILVINPINVRLVRLVGRTAVTPNQLTIIAFFLTFTSAMCMSFPVWGFQAAGGGLLLLAFLVDCMDGDLARLKELKSPLGAMLDPIFDRLGEITVICGAAICGWRSTGEPLWLVGGIIAAGMSQIYFYITDLMLNKVQKDMGLAGRSRSIKISGTSVRFGLIEPFIWGQALLSFGGVAYWGIPLFGLMFSACTVIQLYRLIKLSRSFSKAKSEDYGSHVW